MENRRLFIGNLCFSVNADEVKGLLSQYGTVIRVTLRQKKGYALVEMDCAEAAAQAVRNLDGTMHGGRAVRVSFEMKARKARSAAVQRYKERGESLARQKAARYQPGEGFASGKPAYTRAPKPDAGFVPRSGSGGLKTRPARPYQREDAAAPRPARRAWADKKPAYPRRPGREAERTGNAPALKKERHPARQARPAATAGAGMGDSSRWQKPLGGTTGGYARPRTAGGSHAGFGRPSRPGAPGAAVASAPSRPGARGRFPRSRKASRND